jgi:hypothetical protein
MNINKQLFEQWIANKPFEKSYDFAWEVWKAATLLERQVCVDIAKEAAKNVGDPYCCSAECLGIAETIEERNE